MEGIEIKTEPTEETLTTEIDIEEHTIKLETEEDQLQGDCLPADMLERQLEIKPTVMLNKLNDSESCSTDNQTQLSTQTHSQWCIDLSKTKSNPGNVGVLKCAHCGMTFFHPETLDWHTESFHGSSAIVKVMKINDKQNNFQCGLCESVCEQHSKIIQHLHSQHRISVLPFQCSDCSERFSSKSDLNLHRKSCKNKKVVQRQRCSKSVKPIHQINKFVDVNPIVKIDVCSMDVKPIHQIDNFVELKPIERIDVCSMDVKPNKQSKKHVTRKDGVKCTTCSKVFVSERNMKKHVKIYHPKVRKKRVIFNCLYCEESFKLHTDLSFHCRHSHPGQKIFRCELCSAEFVDYSKHQRHTRCVHQGLWSKCNLCPDKFFYESALKKHVKKKHPFTNPLTCSTCGEKFKTLSILKHVHSAHSGPRVHCAHCKYGTKVKPYLESHMINQHYKLLFYSPDME